MLKLNLKKDPPIATITMPKLYMKFDKFGYVVENIYVLTETYTYTWLKDSITYRINVPQNFETDIASVPQLFWSLGFTPDGRQRAAALCHDWLFCCRYYNKGVCPKGSYQKLNPVTNEWEDIFEPWTVHQANLLFGRMMREAGVNSVKRKIMFLAVEWFAWPIWKERKNLQVESGEDFINYTLVKN